MGRFCPDRCCYGELERRELLYIHSFLFLSFLPLLPPKKTPLIPRSFYVYTPYELRVEAIHGISLGGLWFWVLVVIGRIVAKVPVLSDALPRSAAIDPSVLYVFTTFVLSPLYPYPQYTEVETPAILHSWSQPQSEEFTLGRKSVFRPPSFEWVGVCQIRMQKNALHTPKFFNSKSLHKRFSNRHYHQSHLSSTAKPLCEADCVKLNN
ncbi:hypothetical protein HOY80DRAFT_229224 [Tuber brumale]|nr:hypothetical protein HOY80DRAFT_229224 [Tuber brumale]